MKDLYFLNLKHLFSAFRHEGAAFFFICVYLFFEYVRPQSVYKSIDVLPFVPIVLVLTSLFLIHKNEFKNASYSPLHKYMFFYLLLVLFSSAFSEYPSVSFSRFRVFFDWFVIYFLIVIVVNNSRRFYIFFLLFLVFSFKMSQHGFRSWAGRGFSFTDWGVTGAPGWFHNSGEVGIQMCIFVPMSIAFLIAIYRYNNIFWSFVLICMPITGVATIVASSSRGALIGLIISGFVSSFRPIKLFFSIGVFVSFTAYVIFLIIPEQFYQRFELMGADRNSLHRLERWEHGIDAMNNFPFLGVGFEAWTLYYPQNYIMNDEGTLLVHNIFVQCGSELGYTGLVIFIAMILTCFLMMRKIRKLYSEFDDKFYYFMSYGFDAALVGFLVSGFFVTVLYYPYFWIHCALTSCMYSAALKDKLLM